MPDQANENDRIIGDISRKIDDANNILVALSNSPSVDEMAAALGLTMILNSIGKHVTAIYSGDTPNAIEFLNPEKTFENNIDSLQDFIIALSKEKADHLRYKVEGDFVKIYITPYKTSISKDDLEFTKGDFNVDLVIAIGVETPMELDKTLSEHGRVIDNAEIVNISCDRPGKMGGIEWCDQTASSVSEMIVMLGGSLQGGVQFDEQMATALLTGIISGTDRFLNEKTTPNAMGIASRLMQAGADQQLISINISKTGSKKAETEEKVEEKTEEKPDEKEEEPKVEEEKTEDAATPNEAPVAVPTAPKVSEPAVTPVVPETPSVTEAPTVPVAPVVNEAPVAAPMNTAAIYPSGNEAEEYVPSTPKDYSAMMDQVLDEPLPNPAMQAAPVVPIAPEVNPVPNMDYMAYNPVDATVTQPVTPMPQPVQPMQTAQSVIQPVVQPVQPVVQPMAQPVMQSMTQPVTQPVVQPMAQPVQPVTEPIMQPVAQPVMEPIVSQPVETQSTPAPVELTQPELVTPQEINLPPAPMPPVDTNSAMPPQDSAMQQGNATPVATDQDQTIGQITQANDPSAFKIPGM